MMLIQNQSPIGIQTTNPPVTSDAQLELAVGISLLGDFNGQLTEISSVMRSQLEEKQGLRRNISDLKPLHSRGSVKTAEGEEAVPITDKEYSELVGKNPGLQFQKKGGGGYYLKKESLRVVIEGTEEKLAGLNSMTEITMLRIQSLVDQRKNSLTMLSNLIAARNETTMGIIRNLKN